MDYVPCVGILMHCRLLPPQLRTYAMHGRLARCVGMQLGTFAQQHRVWKGHQSIAEIVLVAKVLLYSYHPACCTNIVTAQ